MKARVKIIFDKLRAAYPQAKCELEYDSPFELLIATILSAQCTDKRVNAVTADLFKKYKTPADFAALKNEVLEKEIFTCGLYKNKAKSIILCAQALTQNFNGQVPDTMEALLSLPGVGRKTANVALSNAFGKAAMAVDTHVFRVARRLGLSGGKTPEQTEKDLTAEIDKSILSAAHHMLIFQGRYTCKSASPQCAVCPVFNECTYLQKRIKELDV